MLRLDEYQRRPASLADWLPWAGLVASGVVLNKDGSFQRTARFRGPDLDSATEGELVATTARLNNALRRFESGWALFVEAERGAAAPYPRSTFPEPLSRLVDEERRAPTHIDDRIPRPYTGIANPRKGLIRLRLVPADLGERFAAVNFVPVRPSSIRHIEVSDQCPAVMRFARPPHETQGAWTAFAELGTRVRRPRAPHAEPRSRAR